MTMRGTSASTSASAARTGPAALRTTPAAPNAAATAPRRRPRARVVLASAADGDDQPAAAAAAANEAAAGPPPPQQQQQQQPQPPKRRRQADSTDAVASFLTRRFGIAGGLAWLGVLTFGVVSEQLKTRRELAEEAAGTRDTSAAAPETRLPGGVSYRELRVGGGAAPRKGDLAVLEFNARFSTPEGGGGGGGGAESSLSDPPFLDTKRTGRPVVLVWGAKPLAGGITEGVEQAIADGMKAGGRRIVTVPPERGFGASPPQGVPAGATLQYDVTLLRVSVAPS